MATAVAPSPSSGSVMLDHCHAVSRSNELLSCAKTALKIAKSKSSPINVDGTPNPLHAISLDSLRLYDSAVRRISPETSRVLEDGLSLLRSMDHSLQQLQQLVRRRGHTNDPTAAITKLVQQLKQDFDELTDYCNSQLKQHAATLPRGRFRKNHAQSHWQYIAQWFQQMAAKQSEQLKEVLKLRGTVLAEQAQRRKMVSSQQSHTGANGSNKPAPTARRARRPLTASSSATSTPLFDSPLFTAAPAAPSVATSTANGNEAPKAKFPPSLNGNTTTATTSSYYSASGYGGGGYGGTANGSLGMRQRKGGAGYGGASASDNSTYYQGANHKKDDGGQGALQQQLQMREQQRQTARRAAEARQAEKQVSELGTLFSKMSNLISEQSEVLEKVEDDVEAAYTDVLAGQEELTKLYGIKKGNRSLIIKTFAILNFLIIFMWLYKK